MAQSISKPSSRIQPPYLFTEAPGRSFQASGPSLYVRKINRALGRKRLSAFMRASTAGLVRSNEQTITRVLDPASPALKAAGLFAQDAWSALLNLLGLLYQALFMMTQAGAACAAASYFKLRLHLARMRVSRLNSVITMGMLVVVIFSSCFYGMGLEAYFDGQSVGYVSSRAEIDGAISSVEARVSDILQVPYKLSPNITYQFGMYDRRNRADVNLIEDRLFHDINGVKKLYVLTVDGETVGASESRKPLDDALNSLLTRYPAQSGGTVEFLRDVNIRQEYTSTQNLCTAQSLAEKLTANIREEKTYVVQSGDTVSAIASANGMKAADLIAINPGLSEKNIKAGSEITVKKALSFLSVKVTKKLIYAQSIAFETKKVEDNTLYKGKTKVVTQGKAGEKQITANAVYVDGKEEAREILSSVVVSQPVTQVVAVGTKPVPAKAATGKFIRPFRGIITSNYGYRGREFHTGVDFAGPVGSKIVASDGGTVVFAGWKGNYGYAVIIRHGSGVETLYGHCSRLLVKTGQKVGKGEAIARLGSTGRSTGPHVHFEVRVGGHYVSPWKYIK